MTDRPQPNNLLDCAHSVRPPSTKHKVRKQITQGVTTVEVLGLHTYFPN
ncbi:hypothetical protein [Rhodococcus sp. JS3073]|nr:hypothetical protein [Rhodococcus sp. JS3073]WAM19089.1 hypothetical protein OYT95_41830 [Rhodococcus sp. JS3073]